MFLNYLDRCRMTQEERQGESRVRENFMHGLVGEVKPVRRRGFTLIELLVVVAIIGILASILMPALHKAREKIKAAVCTSNLKQAGIAIYSYAADGDGDLCTNLFVNTLAGRPIYSGSTYRGKFHDGKKGYLEPYLGDADAAYNCPGSVHPAGFGTGGQTTRQGVYAGFPDFNHTVRKINANYINGPGQDKAQGWTGYNSTPLLSDPILDYSPWHASWHNDKSVIHGNTGYMPILINDGRVFQFNRTQYPAIWPRLPWNYKYIMDDLLQQIN